MSRHKSEIESLGYIELPSTSNSKCLTIHKWYPHKHETQDLFGRLYLGRHPYRPVDFQAVEALRAVTAHRALFSTNHWTTLGNCLESIKSWEVYQRDVQELVQNRLDRSSSRVSRQPCYSTAPMFEDDLIQKILEPSDITYTWILSKSERMIRHVPKQQHPRCLSTVPKLAKIAVRRKSIFSCFSITSCAHASAAVDWTPAVATAIVNGARAAIDAYWVYNYVKVCIKVRVSAPTTGTKHIDCMSVAT